MDKKGEGGSGITFEHVIGLLIGIVVLGVMGGCVYKLYSAQECPVGYEEIGDPTLNPQIDTICRGVEDLDNVVCCQRKSNPFEIIRWDFKNKEEVRKVDLGGFHETFSSSWICKDEIPCGESDISQTCAGVYCEGDKICVVKVEDGKKVGNCEREIELTDGDETAKFPVKDDGGTDCKVFNSKGYMGKSCVGFEFGAHCVQDLTVDISIMIACRGAI